MATSGQLKAVGKGLLLFSGIGAFGFVAFEKLLHLIKTWPHRYDDWWWVAPLATFFGTISALVVAIYRDPIAALFVHPSFRVRVARDNVPRNAEKHWIEESDEHGRPMFENLDIWVQNHGLQTGDDVEVTVTRTLVRYARNSWSPLTTHLPVRLFWSSTRETGASIGPGCERHTLLGRVQSLSLLTPLASHVFEFSGENDDSDFTRLSPGEYLLELTISCRNHQSKRWIQLSLVPGPLHHRWEGTLIRAASWRERLQILWVRIANSDAVSVLESLARPLLTKRDHVHLSDRRLRLQSTDVVVTFEVNRDPEPLWSVYLQKALEEGASRGEKLPEFLFNARILTLRYPLITGEEFQRIQQQTDFLTQYEESQREVENSLESRLERLTRQLDLLEAAVSKANWWYKTAEEQERVRRSRENEREIRLTSRIANLLDSKVKPVINARPQNSQTSESHSDS